MMPPMILRKFFQDNFDKVNYHALARNPNAIPILEKYINDVGPELSASMLSLNPNAVHIFEKYPNNMSDGFAQSNENPEIIDILIKKKRNIKLEYIVCKSSSN